MTRTRFTFPIRVYYEDTDAAGVGYYANYLCYMERARTERLEALGLPLAAFECEHRVAFAVHRAEIDFLRAARLSDRLDVSVEARQCGARAGSSSRNKCHVMASRSFRRRSRSPASTRSAFVRHAFRRDSRARSATRPARRDRRWQ